GYLLASNDLALSASASNPVDVAVGDLNGDGLPDLAILHGNPNGNGSVEVLLRNPDGTYSTSTSYDVGQGSTRISLAHLSGTTYANGLPAHDILVVNQSDTANPLSILLNSGQGAFSPAAAGAVSFGAESIASTTAVVAAGFEL